MNTVKVKRRRATVYTYLPTRFCTHCGARGIYEDDHDDYYAGCGEFCFHCEAALPHELHDPDHSLPLLRAGAEKVVDAKEWEEEIYELEYHTEQMIQKYSRLLALDMYGPPRTEDCEQKGD